MLKYKVINEFSTKMFLCLGLYLYLCSGFPSDGTDSRLQFIYQSVLSKHYSNFLWYLILLIF